MGDPGQIPHPVLTPIIPVSKLVTRITHTYPQYEYHSQTQGLLYKKIVPTGDTRDSRDGRDHPADEYELH